MKFTLKSVFLFHWFLPRRNLYITISSRTLLNFRSSEYDGFHAAVTVSHEHVINLTLIQFHVIRFLFFSSFYNLWCKTVTTLCCGVRVNSPLSNLTGELAGSEKLKCRLSGFRCVADRLAQGYEFRNSNKGAQAKHEQHNFIHIKNKNTETRFKS